MPIGTSGSQGKDMKQPTFGTRRSKSRSHEAEDT